MPETGAMQKDLGSAIAQLEIVKKLLLEVFDWSSRIGVVTKQERSDAWMKIAVARSKFPLIDGNICDYLAQFHVNTHQRLELVVDKEGDDV